MSGFDPDDDEFFPAATPTGSTARRGNGWEHSAYKHPSTREDEKPPPMRGVTALAGTVAPAPPFMEQAKFRGPPPEVSMPVQRRGITRRTKNIGVESYGKGAGRGKVKKGLGEQGPRTVHMEDRVSLAKTTTDMERAMMDHSEAVDMMLRDAKMFRNFLAAITPSDDADGSSTQDAMAFDDHDREILKQYTTQLVEKSQQLRRSKENFRMATEQDLQNINWIIRTREQYLEKTHKLLERHPYVAKHFVQAQESLQTRKTRLEKAIRERAERDMADLYTWYSEVDSDKYRDDQGSVQGSAKRKSSSLRSHSRSRSGSRRS